MGAAQAWATDSLGPLLPAGVLPCGDSGQSCAVTRLPDPLLELDISRNCGETHIT